MTIYQHDAVLL